MRDMTKRASEAVDAVQFDISYPYEYLLNKDAVERRRVFMRLDIELARATVSQNGQLASDLLSLIAPRMREEAVACKLIERKKSWLLPTASTELALYIFKEITIANSR